MHFFSIQSSIYLFNKYYLLCAHYGICRHCQIKNESQCMILRNFMPSNINKNIIAIHFEKWEICIMVTKEIIWNNRMWLWPLVINAFLAKGRDKKEFRYMQQCVQKHWIWIISSHPIKWSIKLKDRSVRQGIMLNK